LYDIGHPFVDFLRKAESGWYLSIAIMNLDSGKSTAATRYALLPQMHVRSIAELNGLFVILAVERSD
jgi:hypothetical protein